MFSNSINSTTSNVDIPMVYGRLKKYWRRKRYQRLHPSDYGINHNSCDDENEMLFTSNIRKKKYMKVARFGGGGGDKHQKANVGGSWRLRVSPKVRLKMLVVTPVIKMLAGIRDAYVNTMLRLAGNVGSLNGNNNVFGGRRIPKARQVKDKKVSSSSKEEFESKLVYEIYRVLAASQQLSIHGDSDF